MTLVAGADVAKGRWVVVVLGDGRFKRAFVAEHLIHLRQRLGPVSILAMDIPIGLPLGGSDWPRAADLEARHFIGPRRSSVFSTPPRSVFDVSSYAKANQLHRELTGKGLSRQSWGLRDRILEAEFFVSENPETVEVHPEVCFRAMRGSFLPCPKKSWNGQMERRSLLQSQGIELPDQLEDAGTVPPDDLLDAAAAAWTAWRVVRGKAEVLPESAMGCDINKRGVIWF
jgi:predicted RNase H-like nuclease